MSLIAFLILPSERGKRGEITCIRLRIAQHAIFLTLNGLILANGKQWADTISYFRKIHFIHPLSPPKSYHSGGAGATKEDMKEMRIYPNLIAEMARAGLTAEQLAQGININPSTMSAKLNNEGRMKLKEVAEIRRIFFPGMEIDYLFHTERS